MSVEQTQQLIQLILNSVLMLTVCVIVLGGLSLRHNALSCQLQSLNQEYFALLKATGLLRGDRPLQIRGQLRQLRQRYRTVHYSIVIIHYALICFVVSTLMLILRTLLHSVFLIHASLVLSMMGLAILLLGMGLALIDFHAAKRSLWEEMNWVLKWGESHSLGFRSMSSSVPNPVPNSARTGTRYLPMSRSTQSEKAAIARMRRVV